MDKQSNNILVFPKQKIPSPFPQNIEQVDEEMDSVKQYHIQEAIEIVVPLFFENLAIAGFSPSNDETDIKDGSFIVESIRSLMCKFYGINHPFQDIAENIFEQQEDGILKMRENIKMILGDVSDKAPEELSESE